MLPFQNFLQSFYKKPGGLLSLSSVKLRTLPSSLIKELACRVCWFFFLLRLVPWLPAKFSALLYLWVDHEDAWVRFHLLVCSWPHRLLPGPGTPSSCALCHLCALVREKACDRSLESPGVRSSHVFSVLLSFCAWGLEASI